MYLVWREVRSSGEGMGAKKGKEREGGEDEVREPRRVNDPCSHAPFTHAEDGEELQVLLLLLLLILGVPRDISFSSCLQ